MAESQFVNRRMRLTSTVTISQWTELMGVARLVHQFSTTRTDRKSLLKLNSLPFFSILCWLDRVSQVAAKQLPVANQVLSPSGQTSCSPNSVSPIADC